MGPFFTFSDRFPGNIAFVILLTIFAMGCTASGPPRAVLKSKPERPASPASDVIPSADLSPKLEANRIAQVAILQFQDLTGSKDYQWVRKSLPQTIEKRMEKTLEFERADPEKSHVMATLLLPPSATPTAAQLGVYCKQTKVDYVVYGNYRLVRGGKKLLVQANVFSATNGRSIATERLELEANTGLFAAVGTVSESFVAKITRYAKTVTTSGKNPVLRVRTNGKVLSTHPVAKRLMGMNLLWPGLGFKGVVVGESTPDDVLRIFGDDCKVYRYKSGEVYQINYAYNKQGQYKPSRASNRGRPGGIDFEKGLVSRIQVGVYQKELQLAGNIRQGLKKDLVFRIYGQGYKTKKAGPLVKYIYDREGVEFWIYPEGHRWAGEINSYYVKPASASPEDHMRYLTLLMRKNNRVAGGRG